MYLHLGQAVLVHQKDIIGIFDLDNTSASFRTRKFLEKAEREGRLISVFDDLPKSFILCKNNKNQSIVYLSQLSSATLRGRGENNSIE